MYITFVDGDVLAFSSSYASGDEYSSPVVSPEKEQVSTLREIMWAMNEVDYTTRTETLSRVEFKGGNFWFGCTVTTMMIPSQIMVVPQYIIMKKSVCPILWFP